MDLAYLTGQRPADTLKFAMTDIKNGKLILSQNKTDVKLRIEISGELEVVINRIIRQNQEKNTINLYLITDEQDKKIGKDAFRYRFDKARQIAGVEKGQFQFRDLRVKAATDIDDIYESNKTLGHKSITTTERYIRNVVGINVKPTK